LLSVDHSAGLANYLLVDRFEAFLKSPHCLLLGGVTRLMCQAMLKRLEAGSDWP
jgi:hypothetical protein